MTKLKLLSIILLFSVLVICSCSKEAMEQKSIIGSWSYSDYDGRTYEYYELTKDGIFRNYVLNKGFALFDGQTLKTPATRHWKLYKEKSYTYTDGILYIDGEPKYVLKKADDNTYIASSAHGVGAATIKRITKEEIDKSSLYNILGNYLSYEAYTILTNVTMKLYKGDTYVCEINDYTSFYYSDNVTAPNYYGIFSYPSRIELCNKYDNNHNKEWYIKIHTRVYEIIGTNPKLDDNKLTFSVEKKREVFGEGVNTWILNTSEKTLSAESKIEIPSNMYLYYDNVCYGKGDFRVVISMLVKSLIDDE